MIFFFLMYIFWWCVLTVFQKKTKAQLDLYSLPTKQGGSVKLLKPDFNAWNIPKVEDLGLAQHVTASTTARDRTLPPLSTDKPSHFERSGLNPSLGPEQYLELQQRLRMIANPTEGAQRGPYKVPLVTTHTLTAGTQTPLFSTPNTHRRKIQISFKVSIFNGSRNSTFSF